MDQEIEWNLLPSFQTVFSWLLFWLQMGVAISCIWAKANSFVLLTATSVGEEFLSAWMCKVKWYTFLVVLKVSGLWNEMRHTMHIRQYLLAQPPAWLSISECRGLSQRKAITGAISMLFCWRWASYTVIPSSSRWRSVTMCSIMSVADAWLEQVTKWMLCIWAFSLCGRPASMKHHWSNLFHFYFVFHLYHPYTWEEELPPLGILLYPSSGEA